MQGERRQLAAVMLTDMVGYSLLSQREEAVALSLASEQDRLVRDRVADHRGITVKSLGDGVLAEFVSALDAVTCALSIQESITERNQRTAGAPITLRIGIHLGDVVHRGDDVFGDAVNIVARVEPHAEHGGVCVTQQVYDQVHNKVNADFRSIGAPPLKNIDATIRLYTLSAVGRTGLTSATNEPEPARPRIVVLPFPNISPDPRDEYFADGMTEELIEKLAHVAGLRVIARTTAMHYKNSHETALEIGRSLQVQMVLEASVRKSGDQLRITAQLIDAGSEEHLWSSSYDRELDDVFAIQAELSDQIAAAISTQLPSNSTEVLASSRTVTPDTTDMGAYTDFLQAREIFRKKVSEETIRGALSLFERAVMLDPAFARARVGLAECVTWLASEGSLPLEAAMTRAFDELHQALDINEELAEAHSALAGLLLGVDDIAGSIREARRAIALNPSLSDPYRWLAQCEAGDGRIDDAVSILEEAYRIDPLDVNVIAFLGRAYAYAGRVNDALDHWNRTQSLVEFRTNAHRTEYLLGQRDFVRARLGIEEMQRIRPGSVWGITFDGVLAALEGDETIARASIARLNQLESDGTFSAMFEAFVYVALGDIDTFYLKMDRCLELHELPLLELLYSSLLAPVRSDPRYDNLLRRQRSQYQDATPGA